MREVKARKGDTIYSIARDMLGSSSFANALASLNSVDPTQPLQEGQNVSLGDFANTNSLYANVYANALPINRTIQTGLQVGQDPMGITEGQFRDDLTLSAEQQFRPSEQRAYSNVIEPLQINRARNIANIQNTMNQRGLLDSSLNDRMVTLTDIESQRGIEDSTDQINSQFDSLKSGYIEDAINKRIAFLDWWNKEQVMSDFELPAGVENPPTTAYDNIQQAIEIGSQPIQIPAYQLQTNPQYIVPQELQQYRSAGSDSSIDSGYHALLTNGSGGIQNAVISQGYGNTPFAQSSGFYKNNFHPGVDIVFGTDKPKEQRIGIPIISPVSGTVVRSGFDKGGYGNFVIIKDRDGKEHRFSHLNEPTKLANGSTVIAGQTSVGGQGTTGASTGPHLDWTIYETVNGERKTVDPFKWAKSKSLGTASQDINPAVKHLIRDATPIESFDRFNKILTESKSNPVASKIYNYFSSKYGDEVAKRFVVVSKLESNWDTGSSLVAGIEDNSYGLFQINLPAHNARIAKYTGTSNLATNAKWLQNPDNSMIIAEEIFLQQGFKPWTVANKSQKTANFGTLGNKLIDF